MYEVKMAKRPPRLQSSHWKCQSNLESGTETAVLPPLHLPIKETPAVAGLRHTSSNTFRFTGGQRSTRIGGWSFLGAVAGSAVIPLARAAQLGAPLREFCRMTPRRSHVVIATLWRFVPKRTGAWPCGRQEGYAGEERTVRKSRELRGYAWSAQRR